jgi:hypothetical protein
MRINKHPFEILQKETSAVEELYTITMWCYKSVSSAKEVKNIVYNEDDSLSLMAKGEALKDYRNIGHLRADLCKMRARELRSVLFVRLISALEVFLIDSIKHAFLKNPQTLSSQKKRLEISYAKLIGTANISELQWELAEKETRNLHSAGFRDVVKYYSSQLGINIADLGINLSQLEHFHDQRHLLVHRLGKTDSVYRHKYNETTPEIKVSEHQLTELIKAIRELSLKLNNAIETLIANTVKPQTNNPFLAKVNFKLLADEFPSILDQSYCFISKDRYLRNADLFKIVKPKSGSKHTMHVHCAGEDLPLIRSVLVKLQRQEKILIDNLEVITGNRTKKSKLPFDHLFNIAQLLPKREDWYQGIHRNLAVALGTSNNKASYIITSILTDQRLMDQLGINVHPEIDKANQNIEPTWTTPVNSVNV